MASPGLLPPLAWKPLELLLNRGLEASASAQAIAGVLEGRCLDVRVSGTPLGWRLTVAGGRIQAGPPGAPAGPPADATIQGGLLSIMGLMTGDAQARIRAGDVQFTGDTEVAERFRELLEMARPDVEEELAKLVGDPLAHRFGLVARELADWSRRAATSVSRSLGEYLTEERRTLPTRAEVGEFYAAVDTLANDVERAAARLERLGSASPPSSQ